MSEKTDAKQEAAEKHAKAVKKVESYYREKGYEILGKVYDTVVGRGDEIIGVKVKVDAWPRANERHPIEKKAYAVTAAEASFVRLNTCDHGCIQRIVFILNHDVWQDAELGNARVLYWGEMNTPRFPGKNAKQLSRVVDEPEDVPVVANLGPAIGQIGEVNAEDSPH